MARVIKTTAFTFNELDEKAKQNARDWFRNTGDVWGWSGGWWKSVQAFCEIAPVTITAADYDRAQVKGYADGMPEKTKTLSGLRAWKWLNNNGACVEESGKRKFSSWFDLAKENVTGACTLTGFVGDCPLFDAIAKVAATPLLVPDLKSLFLECLEDWVIAARKDCEDFYSDESVDGVIIANGYEFTSKGEII